MENYLINILVRKKEYLFEIGEYPHHQGDRCKVKVFQDGKFIASFEPDHYQYLHICQNPGGLADEVLYRLADKIEGHHPQGINKDLEG